MKLASKAGVYECEIAHIVQVFEKGKDDVGNVLPLCRTHHWAFDEHLWGIDPNCMRISVKKGFRDERGLQGLHGSVLKPEKPGAESRLDIELLKARWSSFI